MVHVSMDTQAETWTITNGFSELDLLKATFNQEADYCLGALFTFLSVLGVTGNVLSFSYFAKAKTRNRNELYFRRIYTLITLNDTVISFGIFPTIQAAFTPARTGPHLLFNGVWFRTLWSILFWWTAVWLSTFMVGFLSVSRLVLLVKPSAKMLLPLTWVVPGCTMISVLSSVLLYSVGNMTSHYSPFTMSPLLFTSPTNHTHLYTEPEGPDVIPMYVVPDVLYCLIIACLIMGLPIIPVLTVSLLLLYYLRKYKKGACANKARHNRASTTIIIFTLLYVFCNVPQFARTTHSTVLAHRAISQRSNQVDAAGHYTTAAQMMALLFVNPYIWPLVYYLPHLINSAVNPLVYFWRMTHYRRFVVDKLKHLRGKSRAATLE